MPNHKILVVDDYADSRALLVTLLRNKGFDVIEATDGYEGVQRAANENPDLILMDLAMPQLDGVAAIQRIRQLPELAETPIFALSAYMMNEVRDDAIAAGCNELFSKPLDIPALLERIDDQLGG
ncbi:MAG: response regulator [Pyrinomonadaceae bacterium]